MPCNTHPMEDLAEGAGFEFRTEYVIQWSREGIDWWDKFSSYEPITIDKLHEMDKHLTLTRHGKPYARPRKTWTEKGFKHRVITRVTIEHPIDEL